MAQLRGIETFLKAVDGGSIAAAARQLGITPAAASQNIARLEQALGTRLLVRTTRSLALTEAGELYRARVAPMLAQLEMAESDIADLQGQPQGRLRISCAAAFGRNMLAPLLPRFMAAHPRVAVELLVVDRQVDQLKEDIDISIRYSHALEPGMVVRRIAAVPMVFCAAPAYLQRRGRPATPEDLQQHDCLLYRMDVDGRVMSWPYLREGQRVVPELNAAAVANDIDTLAMLAVHGAGITRLACFIANPLIAQGRLEPLFTQTARSRKAPRIDPEPLEFFLCYRDRQHIPAKVRVFADHVAEALREHPDLQAPSRPR
jgi:DNA-binding transcriptional LysR family regulator